MKKIKNKKINLTNMFTTTNHIIQINKHINIFGFRIKFVN